MGCWACWSTSEQVEECELLEYQDHVVRWRVWRFAVLWPPSPSLLACLAHGVVTLTHRPQRPSYTKLTTMLVRFLVRPLASCEGRSRERRARRGPAQFAAVPQCTESRAPRGAPLFLLSHRRTAVLSYLHDQHASAEECRLPGHPWRTWGCTNVPGLIYPSLGRPLSASGPISGTQKKSDKPRSRKAVPCFWLMCCAGCWHTHNSVLHSECEARICSNGCSAPAPPAFLQFLSRLTPGLPDDA